MQAKKKNSMDGDRVYSCPMHPEVTSSEPGACSKCGMPLVINGAEHTQHGGHEHHASHHAMMAADFKKRFLVSLVVTIPVLLLSPTVQGWLGFSLDFFGRAWVLLALASTVALWGAWPFYKNAFSEELAQRRLGMMVLVSIAVGLGYVYSVTTTFLIDAPDFYWEISTLVVVLLFGHWMEMRAVVGASGALSELAKLIPPVAHKKHTGEIVDVPTEQLRTNDVVLVRPGEKIPIDGEVLEGSSNVNEALITGESKPVLKEKGSIVIGGALNEDGSLTVRVTKTGEDTAVAHIMALVREAQESRPRTQRMADRAAHYLTIVAIGVGVGTLIFWSLVAGYPFVFALTLTMTVVVITCPHALGLAIPTVVTIATSLSAKNGILVKNMDAVERAKDVDTVVFDKTGTLTKGTFAVTNVVALAPEWDEQKVLALAASIEQHSEHVIAKSIVRKAQEQSLALHNIIDYRAIAGKGARAAWQGRIVVVGSARMLQNEGIRADAADSITRDLAGQGKTIVYLAVEGEPVGALALADEIRPEAREAVQWLKQQGIAVAMLTGDSKAVSAHVAKTLNLDVYFAEVLPQEKSEKVAELQSGGKRVMMVGDGINDAPALTRADVAVAIGAGTDVAIESAHVVLVRDNPMDVIKLILLSRKTSRKMLQNLAWATGYNVIAIPMAAGILAPWGVFLRPEWGALAMSMSSVIVVFNALLLRGAKLTPKNN